MKIDFSDLHIGGSKDSILARVSEEEIFRKYCSPFKELGVSFCSELYEDSNAACYIYDSSKGVRYKDFGSGQHLDAFNYVMAKYGVTYQESLQIISNDFKIGSTTVDINPKRIVCNDIVPIKRKPKIEVVSQEFTLEDINYWKQYGISLELLRQYDISSARLVYLHKATKSHIFYCREGDPIYAYKFTQFQSYTYKIYRPKRDKLKGKWMFSGTIDDVEGLDNLNLHGDTVILTKSLKDVLCYRILGYDAISLQGESNPLKEELQRKLLARFRRIIVNYDNDPKGIEQSLVLEARNGLKWYVIPDEYESKDLSDLIKNHGLEVARQVIKQLIDEQKDKDKL